MILYKCTLFSFSKKAKSVGKTLCLFYLTRNLSIKYNPDDDYIYALVDGSWIKTGLKGYAQSLNWFLNGVFNNTDSFGLPNFATGTNGVINTATYQNDGYIYMYYQNTSAGDTTMCSQNKIPVNAFSSITLKFLCSTYNNENGASPEKYKFSMGFSTTNQGRQFYTGLQHLTRYSPSTSVQTVTYNLTGYNSEGVEKYLCFVGIAVTKIYEITFNK